MLLIPRTFHQIWVGPDPLPAEFAGYQKTWLRHNPGWTLQLWTEENLSTRGRYPVEMFPSWIVEKPA